MRRREAGEEREAQEREAQESRLMSRVSGIPNGGGIQGTSRPGLVLSEEERKSERKRKDR